MKIALCNEVLGEMGFAAQCEFAAAVGYEGLEVAPFTLDENPHLLSAPDRARIRRSVTDAGIEVTGLHWLLVTPKGLSINAKDPSVRERTVEVLRRLIELCAELGGKVLVHGSPQQRQVPADGDRKEAWLRARDVFAAIAEDAAKAGVTYCLEPLAQRETNFINTLEEAVKMVDAVGNPAFRTMIDTCSAGMTEGMPVADLVDRWLPKGMVAHIQVNDTNRRSPGQGKNQFAPVFAALQRNGYAGVVSVEPFDYFPDGRAAAALAIGYIRGILEALKART
jgi:D-psicose/D-tagatose/L-ribulose 3-epimerase